jgi:hypothetical protein
MGGFSLSGRGGHRGPKATFTPAQRATYVRRARQLLAQPVTTGSGEHLRCCLNTRRGCIIFSGENIQS